MQIHVWLRGVRDRCSVSGDGGKVQGSHPVQGDRVLVENTFSMPLSLLPFWNLSYVCSHSCDSTHAHTKNVVSGVILGLVNLLKDNGLPNNVCSSTGTAAKDWHESLSDDPGRLQSMGGGVLEHKTKPQNSYKSCIFGVLVYAWLFLKSMWHPVSSSLPLVRGWM